MNVIAKISYLERSVVTLNLRKEYLNTDIQYIILTLDKKLNCLIYRTLFYINIYGRTVKNSPVFWLTLYVRTKCLCKCKLKIVLS